LLSPVVLVLYLGLWCLAYIASFGVFVWCVGLCWVCNSFVRVLWYFGFCGVLVVDSVLCDVWVILGCFGGNFGVWGWYNTYFGMF